MSPDLWLILSFAVLLALGVPVAFALGLSGAIGIIAGLSPDMLAMSHLWRVPPGARNEVASKGAPEAIYRLAKLADRPDADVVFISCTNLASLGVIQRLEDELARGSKLESRVRGLARELHEELNLHIDPGQALYLGHFSAPAANEPGLQVQDMDGNWIDVPCDFGMLIINIGDMLQEASQGYYPSTQHRVVNPTGAGAGKSRVSLPLFLHPRDEVVLSARYSAGAYLDERLRELGVKT